MIMYVIEYSQRGYTGLFSNESILAVCGTETEALKFIAGMLDPDGGQVLKKVARLDNDRLTATRIIPVLKPPLFQLGFKEVAEEPKS